MSSSIVSIWRVKQIDMTIGHSVSLIGGLPGEYVEFTDDGYYRVDIKDKRPGVSRFKTARSSSWSELDIWIEGLEALVKQCIYRIDGDLLTICVAGNSGERPTEFRRDDQLFWCLLTMERAKL